MTANGPETALETTLETTRVHGTLVVVAGVGVLLLGRSGIGKSECAVELVVRGHRLVADDVVLVAADAAGKPIGRSPDLIRHYIELRGIGIVHIPSLFGESSVIESCELELVLRLQPWGSGEVERVGLDKSRRHIGPFSLPALDLPLAPGRNVATLVEVAARDRALQRDGKSAVHDLDARVNRSLQSRD
jgi:HPr kinase/phosphorylase